MVGSGLTGADAGFRPMASGPRGGPRWSVEGDAITFISSCCGIYVVLGWTPGTTTMQPLQELWIGDGDSMAFRIESPWFCVSRGTLLLHITALDGESDRQAILRQHGGEDLWYGLLGRKGDLDSLDGTAWYVARSEGGAWITVEELDPETGERLDEDG